MKSRQFSRTPWSVSEIGFGAWAMGSAWGDVSEADAKSAVHAALDAGMTFVNTADVYGDGRSEKIVRDVLKERGGTRPMVATKAGRRLPKRVVEGYTKGGTPSPSSSAAPRTSNRPRITRHHQPRAPARRYDGRGSQSL